jgi:hypothetical protein
VASAGAATPHTLVIGCGALARELLVLTRDLPGVAVTCIDAKLHMRPERIAAAVQKKVRAARAERPGLRIFVGYADCGTRGALDEVLASEGVERLPGAHCFEFYAGAAAYEAMQDHEVGTFYLTDFIARQFDTFVIAGLGIDEHPELLPLYFGNYTRLVYLAQTDDPELTRRAEGAAERLGLRFERRFTGLGDLAAPIRALGTAA